MSSDNATIQVETLSKSYQIYETPRDRLKQFFLPRIRRGLSMAPRHYFREFWALKEVSFSIAKGETVGIIGRNGAGKSTLLQIICGTLAPTTGTVRTTGRVAALLELGAGFNPEFSGRDNVYLNGMLLGMEKEEIDACYKKIVDFSGVHAFIDQPVKTYSSGMFARLAFSVAVHATPDLLIVDEALSVGDLAFQEKSITRMKEIRERGTSILFVSHSLPAVRNFCETAIWLDKGKVRAMGERLSICEEYQREIDDELQREMVRASPNVIESTSDNECHPLEKSIEIRSSNISGDVFEMGDDITFELDLGFHRAVPGYGVGLIFNDNLGNLVTVLNTLRDDIFLTEPKDKISVTIRDHRFTPGTYMVSIVISDLDAMFSYDRRDHCHVFRVENRYSSKGLPVASGFIRCEHEWSW
ncbi:ABC transporter ATP-binding protein [Cupriavidus cauae]|uniref:ABC transporter ATP-binding protein n=1 Tax=Cupriavidus cauae TaxID=2608999 RepID=UPI00224354DB|nr:ABC transporter ATP-binding protein [Cupriavidus cauae]UZN50265.1 ABC transporter ATP-binding protein [Cupriavidus cauae]